MIPITVGTEQQVIYSKQDGEWILRAYQPRTRTTGRLSARRLLPLSTIHGRSSWLQEEE